MYSVLTTRIVLNIRDAGSVGGVQVELHTGYDESILPTMTPLEEMFNHDHSQDLTAMSSQQNLTYDQASVSDVHGASSVIAR
jgi:hypothetical protein